MLTSRQIASKVPEPFSTEFDAKLNKSGDQLVSARLYNTYEELFRQASGTASQSFEVNPASANCLMCDAQVGTTTVAVTLANPTLWDLSVGGGSEKSFSFTLILQGAFALDWTDAYMQSDLINVADMPDAVASLTIIEFLLFQSEGSVNKAIAMVAYEGA